MKYNNTNYLKAAACHCLLWAFGLSSFGLFAQRKAPIAWSEALEQSWLSQVPLQHIPIEGTAKQLLWASIHQKNHNEYLLAYQEAGLYLTRSAGAEFEQLLPPHISPRIIAAAINWESGTIWIANDEGFYHTSTFGKQWERLSSEPLGHAPQLFSLSEQVLLLHSGGGTAGASQLFKSSDAGKSWHAILGEQPIVAVAVVARQSPVLYVALKKEASAESILPDALQKASLYKSNNGGDSFVPLPTNGLPWAAVAPLSLSLHSPKEGELYALVSAPTGRQAVGKEWEQMTHRQLEKLSVHTIRHTLLSYDLSEQYTPHSFAKWLMSGALSPAKAIQLIGGKADEVVHRLYHSTDEGKNWQELQSWYAAKGKDAQVPPISMAIWQHDEADTLVVATPYGRYKGSGADSWMQIDEEKLLNSPSFFKNMPWGVLEQKADSLLLWENGQPLPRRLPLPQAVGVSAVQTFTLHNTPACYLSMLSDVPWRYDGIHLQQLSKQVGTLCELSGKLMLLDSLGGLTPLGEQQKDSTALAPSLWLPAQSKQVSTSPHSSHIAYAVGKDLLQSISGGKSWSSISSGIAAQQHTADNGKSSFTAVAESLFQMGMLYGGTSSGQLWYSTNAGGKWIQRYQPSKEGYSVVQIVPSKHQKQRVYALLHSSDNTPLLLKSDNYGESWVPSEANLPMGNVNTLVEHSYLPDLLFVGTQSGAFVSFDGAESYHAIGGGLARGAVRAIAQLGTDKVLIGSLSGGLYQMDIRPLVELRAAVQRQLCYPLLQQYEVSGASEWAHTKNEAVGLTQQPHAYIATFAREAGKSLRLRLLKDGVSLISLPFTTNRGFCYVKCPMEVKPSAVELYHKKVGKPYFSPTDDGKYYLPAGSYQLVIEGEMYDEIRTLEVKP